MILGADGISPLQETRMLVRCRAPIDSNAVGNQGGIAELYPSLIRGTDFFCL